MEPASNVPRLDAQPEATRTPEHCFSEVSTPVPASPGEHGSPMRQAERMRPTHRMAKAS